MAKNKANYANKQWLKANDKRREGWTESPYRDGYSFHMIAPNGMVIKIELGNGCKYVISANGDRIGKPSGYELCAQAMIEAEKLAPHL